MDACPSVQDDFLQTLVKDKTAVNVFLVNGIKLSGQLCRFDQFTALSLLPRSVGLASQRSLANCPRQIPLPLQ
ncbi:RNA chaperone Hfq [Paraburkholderia sp. A3BS-1L]|uniref:RNA chaperone Hfq n=1 Tax=Paraburkholderia sp. A3BS-1L TaxID=3028375 RepID=UPI003DA8B42F